MVERQIEHRKSCLVFSTRFPVVKWRSRPVAESAYTMTPLNKWQPRSQGSLGGRVEDEPAGNEVE